MKKKLLFKFFMAVLPLFALSSCDKLKEILSFNVPVEQVYDFEIPVVDSVGTVTIAENKITVDIEKLLKEKNEKLSLGNIKEVRIESVSIIVKDDSRVENNNLLSLKDMELQLKSSVKPNWISLTNGRFTPDQPYEYNLPIDKGIDLSDYFKDETFFFQMTGSNVAKITQTIPCSVKCKFVVKAGLE